MAIFIVQTGINTALEKENSVYCGICAGTTWVDELPAGSRIVLSSCPGKNFDALKPESITINSPAYKKLPVGLQKILTGKTGNVFGFFSQLGAIYNNDSLETFSNNSVSYSELFQKSACYDLIQGNEDSCIKNLREAADHGFVDFDEISAFMKKQGVKSEPIDTELKRLKALYAS